MESDRGVERGCHPSDFIGLAGRCRESINSALDVMQTERIWRSTHRLSPDSASHTSLLVDIVRRGLWSGRDEKLSSLPVSIERLGGVDRPSGPPVRSGFELAFEIARYHRGLLLDEQTQVSFTDALMAILNDPVPLSRQARFVSVGLLKQTAASIALVYSVAYDVAFEASARLWASPNVKAHADLAEDWELVTVTNSDPDPSASINCAVERALAALVDKVCLAFATEAAQPAGSGENALVGASAWSVLHPLSTALRMPTLPALDVLLPWARDSVTGFADSTTAWVGGLSVPILAAMPAGPSSLLTPPQADQLAAASTMVCQPLFPSRRIAGGLCHAAFPGVLKHLRPGRTVLRANPCCYAWPQRQRTTTVSRRDIPARRVHPGLLVTAAGGPRRARTIACPHSFWGRVLGDTLL